MPLPVELLLYVHQIEQRRGRPAGGRGTFRSAEKLSGLRQSLSRPALSGSGPTVRSARQQVHRRFGRQGADRPDRGREHHRGYGPQQSARDARGNVRIHPQGPRRRRGAAGQLHLFVEDQSESGRGLRHQGARLPLAGRLRFVEVCRRRDVCPQGHRRLEMHDHDRSGVAEPQNGLQQSQQFVDVVPPAVYRRHRQPREFRGMAFERGYVGVWR